MENIFDAKKKQIFDETDVFDSSNNFRQKNLSDNISVMYSTSKNKSENCFIINDSKIYDIGIKEQNDLQIVVEKYLKKILKIQGYNSLSKIMMVGIGNGDIMADSLGEKVVSKTLMSNGLLDDFNLQSVCGISPNVFAKTGIPTFEIIKSIVDNIKPNIIVIIDSLATNDLSRLGKSFQITDGSMEPGGAVNGSNKKLSKQSLKTKCVFIGVPFLFKFNDTLLSPKDVKTEINICSNIIANCLNNIFFPTLSRNDILDLIYV